MEKNIEAAVKLYSGEKPWGLFAQHLPENLKAMNDIFEEISALFSNEGIHNFENCQKILQCAENLPNV